MNKWLLLSWIFLLYSCFERRPISSSNENLVNEDQVMNNLESANFPKENNYTMTKNIEILLDSKDLVLMKIYRINDLKESSQIAKMNLRIPTKFRFNVPRKTHSIMLEVTKGGATSIHVQRLESKNISFYL